MKSATGNPGRRSADGDTHTRIDPSSAPPDVWWDADYDEKRNIIILNHDTDIMPAGFPVHVRFDASTDPTAAEIYAASLSATKGDDIRIVYNNQTQLDRVIYTMQSDQIDIWFPVQAALGGGQRITSYQIYYGNRQRRRRRQTPILCSYPMWMATPWGCGISKKAVEEQSMTSHVALTTGRFPFRWLGKWISGPHW